MIIFRLLVVVTCYYQTHILYIYIYVCTMIVRQQKDCKLSFFIILLGFSFSIILGGAIYMIYNTQIVQVTSFLP